MSLYNDIDAAAAARIADIDQQTTDALSLVAAYMPTIKAIAALMAPYYTPAGANYTETHFDQSGVKVPPFTELAGSDSTLREVDAQKLDRLSAGSNDLYPGLREPLDTANSELETIWNDVKDDSEIAFKEDDFVAEIIDEVQTKLISALGDAMGSSTAAESRYYSNDAIRRGMARLKEQTDTLDEFVGRGFNLPSQVLADMGSYVQQKQNMEESDRQRAVIMQQSALSQDNKTRAIDAGLRYDQILIGYFDRKMQRAFQVATAGLKIVQELAEMKFYVLRERLGVQKDYFDLIGENQRLIFAEFDQNAKAFASRLDTLIAEAGDYLDAYTAEGQVYSIRQRAVNENRKFVQSEGEISLDTMRWNLANAIKAFSDNIKAFEATANIRLRAASAGATVQVGIAGAAHNSITSIIGVLSGEKTTKSG